MGSKMLDKWLERYNELDRAYDRAEDKYERHEKEGRPDAAARDERRMDVIYAKMLGMVEALQCFGYTIRYQDGKNVVVEYR